MSSIDVHPALLLERILSIEVVRVTERAAVCAARTRGRGDEIGADKMAVDAMRRELNRLPIDGTVVIGEGERDEAPMLYIGEQIGTRKGPRVDIAVDPLEGTTLCAKNMPGAIATIAIADSGTLLHAPDVYMEKIAVGPGYPKGVVDLDAPVGDNIFALAKVKGVKPADVNVLVLDRPRHSELIASVRKSGAGVRLITDGDIAGVIDTVEPEATGVDMYVGIGGAPEGVLAAAALRCIGGQMQCRLVLDTQLSASAHSRWELRTRPKSIKSMIWCGATAFSPQPESLMGPCCAACSSVAMSLRPRRLSCVRLPERFAG